MIIVLVVHGMPPKDYPAAEKTEYMRLHSQHRKPESMTPEQLKRHEEMDAKIRAWPRTEANDPFQAASYRIAVELKKSSGTEVLVAFNEFCAPSVPEVLDKAAGLGMGEVVVVTPMLTRGGSHAEFEIPEEINAARRRNPGAVFVYAWPFESAVIANFLNAQIQKMMERL